LLLKKRTEKKAGTARPVRGEKKRRRGGAFMGMKGEGGGKCTIQGGAMFRRFEKGTGKRVHGFNHGAQKALFLCFCSWVRKGEHTLSTRGRGRRGRKKHYFM